MATATPMPMTMSITFDWLVLSILQKDWFICILRENSYPKRQKVKQFLCFLTFQNIIVSWTYTRNFVKYICTYWKSQQKSCLTFTVPSETCQKSQVFSVRWTLYHYCSHSSTDAWWAAVLWPHPHPLSLANVSLANSNCIVTQSAETSHW